MKRIIFCIAIFACLFLFSSCSAAPDFNGINAGIDIQEYNITYYQPENEITTAPTSLSGDWDIKSVRDPYADGFDVETDYSMPVYRFDTYEEFVHLEKLIGEDCVPSKDPDVDEDNKSIWYYDYRGGTFDTFSLLLGWFTLETHHDLSCFDGQVEYVIDGEKLVVIIDGAEDCSCSADADVHTVSGLVWISVPKEELDECSSISFILKSCRHTE